MTHSGRFIICLTILTDRVKEPDQKALAEKRCLPVPLESLKKRAIGENPPATVIRVPLIRGSLTLTFLNH